MYVYIYIYIHTHIGFGASGFRVRARTLEGLSFILTVWVRPPEVRVQEFKPPDPSRNNPMESLHLNRLVDAGFRVLGSRSSAPGCSENFMVCLYCLLRVE